MSEIFSAMFDPAEPNVNCGPFIITDFEAGEFYKIEKNPLFHYASDVGNPIEPTSNTTSTTGTTTSQTNLTNPQELSWSLVVLYVIGTSVGIVIIFCIVIIVKERRT